jgi:hypothetical protein
MVDDNSVLWKTWRDAVRFGLGTGESEPAPPDFVDTVQERAARYASRVEEMIRGEPIARYVLRGRLAATKAGDFVIHGPEGGSLFEVLGLRAGHPVRVSISRGTGPAATHTLIAPRVAGPFLQIDTAKPREMDMIEALRYTLREFAAEPEEGAVEIIFQVFAPLHDS